MYSLLTGGSDMFCTHCTMGMAQWASYKPLQPLVLLFIVDFFNSHIFK